jgi:hypothetical protein
MKRLRRIAINRLLYCQQLHCAVSIRTVDCVDIRPSSSCLLLNELYLTIDDDRPTDTRQQYLEHVIQRNKASNDDDQRRERSTVNYSRRRIAADTETPINSNLILDTRDGTRYKTTVNVSYETIFHHNVHASYRKFHEKNLAYTSAMIVLSFTVIAVSILKTERKSTIVLTKSTELSVTSTKIVY